MATDKDIPPAPKKSALKLSLEKRKETKQKRTERQINREINSMLDATKSSPADMKDLTVSLNEIKVVMNDAQAMFTDILSQVEKGITTVSEETGELRNNLGVFRRDVTTFEEQRKKLIERITKVEANLGEANALSEMLVLYGDAADFAINFSNLLLPQANRIGELCRKN